MSEQPMNLGFWDKNANDGAGGFPDDLRKALVENCPQPFKIYNTQNVGVTQYWDMAFFESVILRWWNQTPNNQQLSVHMEIIPGDGVVLQYTRIYKDEASGGV
tara:strand:- start:434 stop:742 length:309 start_codon:yes stop_codon:yes gene_type:complete